MFSNSLFKNTLRSTTLGNTVMHSAIYSVIAIAFAGVLTGCQPTSETASETHDEHAEEMHHDEQAHEEGMPHDEHHEEIGHDEHEEGMHHDEHEHDEHAHDENEAHAGHNHDDNRIKFNCDGDESIGVYYHDDNTPKTAHLLIDDIEYDLTELADASQQTFVSPIGFEEGMGIVWQVTGDDAVLSQLPAQDIASDITLDKLDNMTTVHKCHKAS